MRYPQVVVYETRGELASEVADLAREHSWVVRESRQPEACLNLLRSDCPSVLLLKLERRLVDELALLTRIQQSAPESIVIAVSDVKMENAAQRSNLAGLVYDLGASYVLFPPLMRSTIEDLVLGLMQSAIARKGLIHA